MSFRAIWMFGISAFLLLGWLGIYSDFTENWPGGGGSSTAEQQLLAKANAALNKSEFTGVSVKIEGQKAVLSGVVTSRKNRDVARGLVLQSTGRGGMISGGITVVDVQKVEVIAPVENPFWKADLSEEGQLVLSGYVSGEMIRVTILSEAAKVFPGTIIDGMKIAPSSFAGAVSEQITALGRMVQLASGSVILQGNEFKLTGMASDRELARLLSAQMSAMKGAYHGLADLGYPPPEPNKFGVRVEEGAIEDITKCQTLFAEALSKNTILFASGSSEIDAGSYEFLNFLATLAGQCEGFSLSVNGHTDNTGDRSYNIYLSTERAKAVTLFLADAGVEKVRMTAAGFGPDQPVCTDNTSNCRRRNRRIEISVGQKEL